MRPRWTPLASLLVLLIPAGALLSRLSAEPPRTVAETSDFKATSRHADVMAFCEQLAKESPVVRVGEMGVSQEGRKLPLLIVADPPVSSAEEARRSSKMVVFALGNIHAGEVDGKEGLLMLARDIATAKERPLLKNLILVFAPIFNADGNEKFAKTNRPEQAGPEEVGTRANAQGFDLNRDFVKLESPEVRSLVRFFNKWDPAVFIDCHTTNGSYHRYTITYEGGRNPAGDGKLLAHVRDEMLADVGKRLEKDTGYKSWFYGIATPDHSRWETLLPNPRVGIHYVGLRNRVAILSESYSYAPFKERVLASRGFVKSIFEYTNENRDKIAKLLSEARDATVKAGRDLKEDDKIALQYKAVPLGRVHPLLGFEQEVKDGKRVPTDKPKEYETQYMGGTETTLSVRRPSAYLLPASLKTAVETLQRHGVEVEELREDIELDVEAYRVDKITRVREFQKHQPINLEVTARTESKKVEAGTILVKTAQPLGSLAAFLLEPQSQDGLATWNFFDEAIKEGQDYPVMRLPVAAVVSTGRVRPLQEERTMNKPITPEVVVEAERPLSFAGNPASVSTWLDDGEHYLQTKEGVLRKVQALTGRSQPLFDPEKLAKGLGTLPTIDARAAGSLARSPALRMNPQRTGAVFEYQGDLYFCNLDGTKPVRLTKSAAGKELVTFSPDGRFVAFVRGNNLHVVDVATQAEKALTADGGGTIFNGKADWVYFEEIFDRNHQAYWWSPDSSRIVFLRFDDAPVRKFAVTDPIAQPQAVESTPYPKAGAPNPTVKLGVVAAGGGEPQWVDLADYTETATLIIRAGWTPDSQQVYFYAQDRAQTWLDVCTSSRDGGPAVKLFRDTTKAWVEDPGAPTFLKDGSFLLPSERSGWKHLYHFEKDGKLKGAVTSGEWEMRTLHRVDEEGGYAYFSGTCDGTLGSNLYRIKLDGTGLQRLTSGAGDHRVSVSPKCNLFADSWSDHDTPTKVRLYKTDGALARTLDTNPVYTVEEYRRGQFKLVQIKTPDGFTLEGSLLKPPDFDAAKKYPVWFMTYAGPHAPTVSDAWQGGRVRDEMLAQMGFVVFRCDPRSASGKGAVSTWTAYKQLGVQEMKDIDAAIKWLTSNSWVDPERIGMSGHSYGGFMTAYAMTHSKLFAAGIAGAPVTDWRYYDSIYTERYMNIPQENQDGYNSTSVVKAARNLHGKLLLVHGMMDDNVHTQNSMAFIDALQRANKDFEVMVYPKARHGIPGKHYQRLTLDFMKRTLKP